jgi:NADH:ubiquinone oxidoreductase subunit 6 (subunit J)
MEKAAFYILTAIALLCAALAVSRRNVTHAAVILGTALLAVAGIFLLLQATSPFILQLILVIALAAILFSPGARNGARSASPGEQQSSRSKLVAVVIALVLAIQVVFTVFFGPRLASRGLLLLAGASPATQTLKMAEVLRSLLQNYLLPCEMVVVLILVAGLARKAIRGRDA